MGTRYLYLVRHAQRAPESPFDGWFESPLTSAGIEQARMAAERLASLPISTIYSSPVTEAAETAEILAQRHPAVRRVVLPALTECIPVMPRFYVAESISISPADYARMKRRADTVYARIFKPTRGADRHELVVSHGNLLRYLLLRALGVDTAQWAALDLMNCSVSVVVCRFERFWVAAIGDVGHLPPRLQTYVRERVAHAF